MIGRILLCGGAESFLCFVVTLHLREDITLYTVNGGVVRVILLCLVKQGKDVIGILVVGLCVVDKADDDGLVLRILCKTFLKDLLLLCGEGQSTVNVCDAGVYVTVVTIVVIKADLIILQSCVVVLDGSGGEGGVECGIIKFLQAFSISPRVYAL